MRRSGIASAEELREHLHYCPETGVFTRLISSRSDRIGKVAGSLNKTTGYRLISVNCRAYYGHRLAWLYMTGAWPQFEIDHEDTNRANNRWSNLRPATRSQNAANTSLRSTNTSGCKGVSFYKPYNKWRAYITVAGKHKGLGYFDSKEKAAEAYTNAANDLHGEFARLA